MIGRQLSRYEIRSEISRGGMGVVYKAIDLKLKREIALKVLPPGLVSDRDRKRRFVQEAQSAAGLKHPNVAHIYEVDEVDGIDFIAMELVEGDKLSDLLRGGALPVDRSLSLAVEIAEGLASAHDTGVVHRDLKPANVMVTRDGHAKIIDFGLAKLVESSREPLGDDVTAERLETEPGIVMGTVSYMSPEQATGRAVDHRSDIFSFGIVLFEMLTGERPFQGASGPETVSSILRDPVPRLSHTAARLPGGMTDELQRILDRFLAKEPNQRYDSLRTAAAELRALRQQTDSQPTATALAPPVSATKHWRVAIAAALLASLLAGGAYLLLGLGEKGGPAVAPDGRPTIAVLYFENASGDEGLDWLRTGLTDMLVTDLSQSPNVDVLSTDRLYQILAELNRIDERVTSLEVVREVAERSGATNVIVGSFMKAGDDIRINLRVQDASSGQILASERVDGRGEAAIFPMVDDLSSRIKSNFDLPPLEDPELDLDLRDVTTASVEAYRTYIEGLELHIEGRAREAIPLFERAVEIDPEFAMAYGRLGAAHSNLFQFEKSMEYNARALEHVDRLPARERYYIEGLYGMGEPSRFERAIEIQMEGAERFPRHISLRHNLGLAFWTTRRYEEAIEQYEDTIRVGNRFPHTYNQLAASYAALGRTEEALGAVESYVEAEPVNPIGHLNLGEMRVEVGRLEEALESFDRVDELAPGNPMTALGRGRALVMLGELERGEAELRKGLESPSPFARWNSARLLASISELRGRPSVAVDVLREHAVPAFPEAEVFTFIARTELGRILLELGEPRAAVAAVESGRQPGRREMVRMRSLGVAAQGHARLGEWTASDQATAEMEALADVAPEGFWARELGLIRAARASLKGDVERSIEALLGAETELEPVAIQYLGPPTPHVLVWSALGEAYHQAGDLESAAIRFRRVAESGTARWTSMLDYARSFYYLGTIQASLGDDASARANLERFLQLWGDGDFERELVAEARRRLQALDGA